LDLVYGIPTLAVLIFVFGYVRRIARRRNAQLRHPRKPPKYVRSLTQRSEMRAGEDVTSVMEHMQRTHSRPPLDQEPTPSRNPRQERGPSSV
jgi:hypothetical protein